MFVQLYWNHLLPTTILPFFPGTMPTPIISFQLIPFLLYKVLSFLLSSFISSCSLSFSFLSFFYSLPQVIAGASLRNPASAIPSSSSFAASTNTANTAMALSKKIRVLVCGPSNTAVDEVGVVWCCVFCCHVFCCSVLRCRVILFIYHDVY